MRTLKLGIEVWNRFWFSKQDKLQASVFRIVVAAGLFFFYLDRYIRFDFIFSEKGTLPFEALKKLTPPAYEMPFGMINLMSSETVVRGMNLGYLAALLLLCVGWWPRALTFFIFAIHNLLINRNPMIQYGPDMIAGVWLLYLSLIDHSSTLRLPMPFCKNCRKGHELERGAQAASPAAPDSMGFSDLAHSVGVRLFQIQLCIIYGYSGIEKLRGVTWWRGDAIWNALAHGQMVTVNLGFLRYMSWVVIVATYSTLAWEIYFPAIIWNKKLRPWVLAFGVSLHLGIAITMAIPYFSYLMVASYVFFLEPETLSRFIEQRTQFFGRSPELNA